MGMPRKEFWYGDTWAAVEYRQAHNLKLERESGYAHLQGFYIYQGLNAALNNALGGKRARKQKYIEEPIRVTPLTPDEKAAKVKDDRNKAISFFSNLERASDRENEAARASLLLSADGSNMIICPYCDTYQTRRNVCVKCSGPLNTE